MVQHCEAMIIRQKSIFDYIPTNLIGRYFFMTTTWKTRQSVNTSWGNNDRDNHKTKSRKYMLGSFFELVLTAITDPKDDKAIRIKSDPAYYEASSY